MGSVGKNKKKECKRQKDYIDISGVCVCVCDLQRIKETVNIVFSVSRRNVPNKKVIFGKTMIMMM